MVKLLTPKPACWRKELKLYIEWSLIARETSRTFMQIFWELRIKLGPGNVTQLVEFLPGLHKVKPRAPQTGYGFLCLWSQNPREQRQNSKVLLSYLMSSQLVLATWDPVSQKTKAQINKTMETESWGPREFRGGTAYSQCKPAHPCLSTSILSIVSLDISKSLREECAIQ